MPGMHLGGGALVPLPQGVQKGFRKAPGAEPCSWSEPRVYQHAVGL